MLTDCPHREKLGWLEQYHLNGPGVRYEFDADRIFIKGMRDMADSQLDTGLVPNIAPEYIVFDGTFRAAAEWGSAVILVPWQHYESTGDASLLRDYYPPCSAISTTSARKRPTILWKKVWAIGTTSAPSVLASRN